MDSIPQKKLCELIAQYGESLHHDPCRCEALLRDFCGKHGTYPKEISLIRQAHDQGMVQDLLSSNSRYESVEAKWLKTLREDYALTEEAARWTIETWAKALGVSSTGGSAAPRKTGQIWPAVGVAAAVLALIGYSAIVQQQEQERIRAREAEQRELQRQEAQRQEAQRKATIEAAYDKLVCPDLPIDQTLKTQKPDFVYPNGTKYYGPMRQNLPLLEESGSTSLTLPRQRTMIYSNGSRYDGSFKNDARSGCGTYTFSSGIVYIGQFSNDRFNGIGLVSTVDKQRYIGDINDGRCHGEGLLILPDGQLYSGTWEQNKLQGTGLQCGLQ
jgi:hypothetical protein